jgi:hypothetical protein
VNFPVSDKCERQFTLFAVHLVTLDRCLFYKDRRTVSVPCRTMGNFGEQAMTEKKNRFTNDKDKCRPFSKYVGDWTNECYVF